MLCHVSLLLSCFLPFYLYQAYIAQRYCHAPTIDVSQRPYCSSLFPSVYSFVQWKYWNVGFLNYWTLQQAPNFLFALPSWILSTLAIYQYAYANPRRWLTLDEMMHTIKQKMQVGTSKPLSSSTAGSSLSTSVFTANHQILIYMYYWCVLFGICIFILHGESLRIYTPHFFCCTRCGIRSLRVPSFVFSCGDTFLFVTRFSFILAQSFCSSSEHSVFIRLSTYLLVCCQLVD